MAGGGCCAARRGIGGCGRGGRGVGGCAGTHVLLPDVALLRRRDEVAVIGAAIEAKVCGWGYRRIAARLAVPADTVRGWLARFAQRAELVRAHFTRCSILPFVVAARGLAWTSFTPSTAHARKSCEDTNAEPRSTRIAAGTPSMISRTCAAVRSGRSRFSANASSKQFGARARRHHPWARQQRLKAAPAISTDPLIQRAARDPHQPPIRPDVIAVGERVKASAREISTLSPTLRSAWDGRPLAILTRTAPARATGAHIALIGHITQAELRRHTTTIELANGYLNRILIVACRRQRLLPEGGHHDPLAATGLTRLLAATLTHAQTAGQIRLDADARELWHHAYQQLAQPRDGILGQITARAEAHTIRLALIYALADGQRQIGVQHLTAALALQDYAARSAGWALTGATGQPLAEQIHTALTANPAGLTRSQISDTLKHNQPAGQLDTALRALQTAGRATVTQIATGGRPAQLWTAAPAR